MEKEENKKVRSKLAIISFILSLIPILMIILYIALLRNVLLNSPLFITLVYNLIIEYLPLVSLVLSIISIVFIKKKKTRGLGLAISALIISLLEGIYFIFIVAKYL